MKFLLIFFLFLITTFAQNWQSEISLFNIPSHSKINSCVSNKGIHVIYAHNGGVKYALSKPDGTVIKNEIVIENEGAGCSVPAIASVNNEVYAFYVKNNNIYMAKSTDLGDTWIINTSNYPLITTNCDSLLAQLETNYINIVWSGKAINGYNIVNYVRFVYSGQSSWLYYKNVSDLDLGNCDMPTIAVSSDRIHVSYRHSPIVKTRDMIKSDQTWTDPQMVSDVVEGTVAIYENTFSINSQLHAIVMYKNFDGGSCWISHYIRATDNLTWQQSGSNLYTCMGYGQLSASTSNNNIHLIYYDLLIPSGHIEQLEAGIGQALLLIIYCLDVQIHSM